jgi:hypothetical protein
MTRSVSIPSGCRTEVAHRPKFCSAHGLRSGSAAVQIEAEEEVIQ